MEKGERASGTGTGPAGGGRSAAGPRLPLFYRRPEPLDPVRHAALGLARNGTYVFARETHFCPLLLSEMALAARHYPILFTGGTPPMPVALLGVRAGRNLFVDDEGRWAEECYVPAYVRRYPFIFWESGDRSQIALCVDREAETLAEDGEGRPLIRDGTPSGLARSALEFCTLYDRQHQATRAMCRTLEALDLFAEKRADVNLRTGERSSLTGFRLIEEERFKALDDAAVLDLRHRGWLPAVYLHLASQTNWQRLADRAARG